VKKGGKTVLRVLIGVLIALIPTVIVLSLLSYDREFSQIMRNIINWTPEGLIRQVFNVIFGIPVGMYIFGMYFSSVHNKCRGTITAEGCYRTSEKAKIASTATIIAATAPLIIIYVIFFISQWPYYAAGFSGTLPEGMTYSQFAREGFGQLCAVSVINFMAIAFIGLLTKKKADGGFTAVKRIVSVLLSVSSLFLMTTAFAKMIMYVNAYGLTHLRVYAAWFMAMLALVFILVIFKQIFTKFKLLPTAIAVCVVMFAGLAFANVDGNIAKYNVDAYLSGKLPTVDVYELDELGVAAVPQMIRLKNELEGVDDEKAQNYVKYLDRALYRMATDYKTEILSFTVRRAQAEKALKEAGYIGG